MDHPPHGAGDGDQELPDLDLVVLSHLHGDHFDRVARHGLDRAVPDFLDEVDRRKPPSQVVTVGWGETLPLPVTASWTG